MEKMFETGKRQLPSLGGTAKKKKEGECAGESGLATATAESEKGGGEQSSTSGVGLAMRLKTTKCKKFLGLDYYVDFKPDPNYNYHTNPDPEFIPRGALLEHRPHFSDLWFRYDTQLRSSHGMDIDTYPGNSLLIEAQPMVLTPNTKDYVLARELIDLALDIYNNDPSHEFKYEFLKIEKANQLLTGFLLFFMTVKVRNVTLGTVIETFQIYAGESNCMPHQVVFCCVPKAGELPIKKTFCTLVILTNSLF